MTEPLIIEIGTFEAEKVTIIELIGRTPLKGMKLDEIELNVDRIWSLIKNGAHKKDLYFPLEMEGLNDSEKNLIIDMALTRKRSKEKYTDGDRLFFTSEGLRWATPQTAAQHCSNRMGRDLVIDVTCGQGGQVISLADTCERVIGIDLDPLNCLVSILNCRALGKINVTIVNGNCLAQAQVDLTQEGCAIFSDPARPPDAMERTLDEIIPDPREVMKAYGRRVSGMCFEIPPYISTEKVEMDCEFEYLSINGRLNRLNIYLGDLVSSERSAVSLPEGAILRGSYTDVAGIEESDLKQGEMIYEVDPAVVKAGLEEALTRELSIPPNFIHLDGRRCMLSSRAPIDSPFLMKGFKILAVSLRYDDLISTLKDLGAGSVTLRYKIDPKDYWKVRRSIESKLDGNRKVSLFKGKDHLVLEKI